MTTQPATVFETFAPDHWMAMSGPIAAGTIALTLAARRGDAAGKTVARVLATVLVVNEIVLWLWSLHVEGPGMFVRHRLPLHICGAGVFVAAAALITRKQLLYELCWFWGIVGTLQAVITPDCPSGYPTYRFFQYFINHGSIVAAAVVMTAGLAMRPRAWGFLRVYGVTAAFAAVVAVADWLLKANYMFLRHRPDGQTPFFFLPWPWYLVFIGLLGLGLFYLAQLPFDLVRCRRETPSAGEG